MDKEDKEYFEYILEKKFVTAIIIGLAVGGIFFVVGINVWPVPAWETRDPTAMDWTVCVAITAIVITFLMWVPNRMAKKFVARYKMEFRK